MKDAKSMLLAVPGVTEAQVFAKVLVRCEFPMSPETMTELQCVQAQIEYETGWKVEMAISPGKRPERKPPIATGGLLRRPLKAGNHVQRSKGGQ